MKIGMVCYPTIGGSGIIATELGEGLANLGHEVHFISYAQPVRLSLLNPKIFFHKVETEDYPLFKHQPFTLAQSTKILEVTKRYKLDLVHVHYAVPNAFSAYMAKQMLKAEGINLPVLTTLHGTDITLVGKNKNYQSAVIFSIENSDKVTAVSHSLKQDTVDFFGIKPEKIEVVWNFIDHQKFELIEAKRLLLADPNEKIIVHSSNLRKVKQPLKVIEIFKKIQEKVPSKLIVMGEGPELKKMQNLAKEYGIIDKVRFMGETQDIYCILKAADLFLLPSSKESFGLSALEAMAANTPVISSNLGGIPEVNLHEETGFLYDFEDVKSMSKSAIELLSDEQKLRVFKQNAKKRSLEFSMDKILPFYVDIYGGMLHL